MTGTIEYAELKDIKLDPLNPRLGRSLNGASLSQDEIYDRMKDWSLEELATSFLESGFWVHEAVLCVKEELDGEEELVVVEGNRRIAALKRLAKTFDGEDTSKRWLDIIDGETRPDDMFKNVPIIVVGSRQEIVSFLGFRHVTGIKEWAPPEKAQFIAKMIDEGGLSYRDVMRKIGSKTPTVQRNYIAYCILRQMDDIEDVVVQEVEDRFSVLFLSIRTSGVRNFLNLDPKFQVEPGEVYPPIPEKSIPNLVEFSRWLFGDQENSPVVNDSRQIEKFASVLASEDGLEYLRRVRKPSLDKAFVIAGGDQEEVYDLISTATVNLQEALTTIHFYKEDDRLKSVSKKMFSTALQIKETLGIE
ncbi:hypothetical protein [Psychromarinibacter halotolerans]|uniref:ParB/Sulfiredoxin domain-containing protein n=1 Tax=Psychromarinibacter halotolerans TaxID=1775175 RepID=A0ABV7GV95_9RHOB|nr:hypothetical protein [Psychromarinibacter halotolerans]MDF0596312.1 hypothetical protein [Psychromarinibacter halotolerans]